MLALIRADYVFAVENNGTRPFNKHNILSDFDLTDYESMSIEGIKNFFKKYSSSLLTYKTKDNDGNIRDAAEIIWRASQNYGISPKFILTLIQKEQSLIENANPTSHNFDWAAGYGLCDSCSSGDPALDKFRGFAHQIDLAAWKNRYYLAHPEEFGTKVNQPRLIDGEAVVPKTQATANLYTYTPHLHGNEIFWNLWNRYFSRSYPNGTLLQDENNNDVWLLQDNKLRLFLSKAALLSDFDVRKIVTVSTGDLDTYEIGVPIKFSNYSLLRAPSGTVYLIVDGYRRGISSPEALRRLGYNPEEIINVEWSEVNNYPEGRALTAETDNPLGELLQNKKNGAVFYLLEGVIHPIVAREILKNRFLRYPIKSVDASVIEKYTIDKPATFRDGELIKSNESSSVYVIADGEKHQIMTEEAFLSKGYKWVNVITTTPNALDAHVTGAPID